MKHQDTITQQEMARRRIQERRRRQAAKRRRRKQVTLAVLGVCAVVLCVGVFRFLLPAGEQIQPPDEDQSTVQPGADGPGDRTPQVPDENFDHVDITPRQGDSEELLALKELAAEQPRVKKVIENISAYPEELIALVLKNQEAVDYVADYPEKHR